MKRYSINELASILGVTRTAVNRKVDKHKFETVQEYVNGRTLKLVCINNEQLEALKKETDYFKTDNTILNNSYETKINNDTFKKQDFQEETPNIVETMLKELRYYADTAINAEREKTLLIEDKSKQDKDSIQFYQGEISRLTQELNSLKAENERLKIELKRPFWQKKII